MITITATTIVSHITSTLWKLLITYSLLEVLPLSSALPAQDVRLYHLKQWSYMRNHDNCSESTHNHSSTLETIRSSASWKYKYFSQTLISNATHLCLAIMPKWAVITKELWSDKCKVIVSVKVYLCSAWKINWQWKCTYKSELEQGRHHQHGWYGHTCTV